MALPLCPCTWKLLCCLVRGQKVGEMPAKSTPKAQPGQTDRTQVLPHKPLLPLLNLLIPCGIAAIPFCPEIWPQTRPTPQRHPTHATCAPAQPGKSPKQAGPSRGKDALLPRRCGHSGAQAAQEPSAVPTARSVSPAALLAQPGCASDGRSRCPPPPSADAGLALLFIGAERGLILPCSTFSIL